MNDGARLDLDAASPSILFEHPSDEGSDAGREAPDFLDDLRLGNIVDAVTSGKEKEEYNIPPFFSIPLDRLSAITYRHEVFRDMEDPKVLASIEAFAQRVRTMRHADEVAGTSRYAEHEQAWFLRAVRTYCDAVTMLAADLSGLHLAARGLIALRDHVHSYTASEQFKELVRATNEREAELASIRYAVLLEDGGRFTVRPPGHEPDYSIEVERSFAKFRQSGEEGRSESAKEDSGEEINHIEAKMLEFVARLHPEAFARLATFCMQHAGYADQAIARFDREVHFYLFYIAFMADLGKKGLSFCYPDLSGKDKAEYVRDSFDLALAEHFTRYGGKTVTNGYELKGRERILVVTGPNQGGKTTFARMFGQLHYLARLGVPVPGTAAKLHLCDGLFTHFEREENVESLRGKLEDDLVRAHRIINAATPRSVIVLNEIFTSTTLHDETFLSMKLMAYIVKLDALCVWVTFVDELSRFSPATVSMVGQVDPRDPSERTFKVEMKPADGRAYAMAIARKYRLTHNDILERIRP